MRDVLDAPLFSIVASWTVVATAVVAVLSVATRSWLAALVTLALYGAYAAVGFERLYASVSRRWSLGDGEEFVVRSVGFAGGAMLLAVLLSALSPVVGAFGVLAPGSNPFVSWLVGSSGLLSAFMLAVALAGVVVAYEGVVLLARRVIVGRTTPFVGGSVKTGLVSLSGRVRATRRTDWDGLPENGRTAGNDDHGPDFSTHRGSADVEIPSREETVTDGGRRQTPAAPSVEGSDPFEGTAFEPMGDTSTDESALVPDPATFDDPTPGSGTGVGRTRETGGGALLTRGADADSTPLDDYGAEDPVVVDGETAEVVARRRECSPEQWRRAVVDWLAASFEERHGVDLREDPEARHRLRVVADRARSDLAERTETEVLLPFIADVSDGATHLRRTLATVAPSDGEARPPFEGVEVSDDHGREFRTEDSGGDLDVEVRGEDPDRTVEAPLTGTDCVAYRHRAWERDRVDVGERLSVTTRRLTGRDAGSVDFEVEAFGTPVYVDGDEVNLSESQSVVERTADGVEYEASIEPGDTVSVVGTLEERPDGLELRPVGDEGVLVTTRQSGDLAKRLTRGGLARVVLGAGTAVVAAAATPAVATGTLLSGAVGVGAVAGAVRWNLLDRVPVERLPLERLPVEGDPGEWPRTALLGLGDGALAVYDRFRR